ncbi:MAG: S41 family peptidase, partial [Firmicutes bacterium]|nr:S41 family peptidase [Bacillota bacterium]
MSGYYKQDGRVNKFVVGLTVVAVVFFVFFVAVAAIVGTNYKQLGNFIKVYALVHSQYIEPTDTANLVDGATHGMVESLGDPYSIYLDAAMFKQLEDQIHGSFAGLGILVGLDKDAGSDKGLLTVKRVYKDTPAYRQGLKEGDRITAIDERDARGIDLDTAIKLMRGPVGSKVTLTVLHAGSAKPVRLELVRAEIRVPTVEGKMLSGSRIGHISITQFTEKTPGEMDSVLANLQKQEMNGLILDLRNNPGGELGSVTKVADNFVPQGPIVYVDYRSGAEEVRNADEQYLH